MYQMPKGAVNLCLLSAIFLSAFPNLIFSTEPNHYWREYTGTIPPDALIAGHDINGQNVHIGQAYVQNGGLIVVQIKPGAKTVAVPIKDQVITVDKYIKILCGNPKDFNWTPTTAKEFHSRSLDNYAIVGGHEDGKGVIHVARIRPPGEIRVGKINSFMKTAYSRYVDDYYQEPLATSFEVLIVAGIYDDISEY